MQSEKRVYWVGAAVVCVLPTCALAAGGALADPSKPGPYPVGVTRTTLVDHSRTDALTGKPRTLVTEIWYPATDAARGLPKNKYTDFLSVPVGVGIEAVLQLAWKKSAAELNACYGNDAVRDARVRQGRFPLIVFSHGNGGMRHQNTFWCDHLASHGYIIVSADHTGNARFTIIDGEVIPYAGDQRQASAVDRPTDMRFLLDEMTRWDKGADSRFTGRIDTEKVAATGMSFGGFAAVQAIEQDARFKAVIPMAGARGEHNNLATPALVMIGTEDRTIGKAGNAFLRKYHADNEGPSCVLEFKNGGHYTFSDMFKINPSFGDGVGKGRRGGAEDGEPFEYTSMERSYEIINAYSTAFCGLFLKGQAGYRAFLAKNHWPDDVDWQAKDIE